MMYYQNNIVQCNKCNNRWTKNRKKCPLCKGELINLISNCVYNSDKWSLFQGDSHKLIKHIPDNSIDMIFTDPIYEDMSQYRMLARESMRVLKLKGPTALLVFCSIKDTAEIERTFLKNGLRRVWPLHYVVKAKPAKLRGYNVFNWITPCLWFTKTHSKARKGYGIPDTEISTALRDTDHRYNKNISVLKRWLVSISEPNSIILDPFAGYASIGESVLEIGEDRQYIGFEINTVSSEYGAKRLDMVSRKESMFDRKIIDQQKIGGIDE